MIIPYSGVADVSPMVRDRFVDYEIKKNVGFSVSPIKVLTKDADWVVSLMIDPEFRWETYGTGSGNCKQ